MTDLAVQFAVVEIVVEYLWSKSCSQSEIT